VFLDARDVGVGRVVARLVVDLVRDRELRLIVGDELTR